MKNIVFVRIDDRLIHGQVMTAWVKYANANEILIVDEELEHDEFMKIMMKALIPTHIKLNILGSNKAYDYLNADGGKERIFILCKSPEILIDLHNYGVKIESVNLGGMGMKGGRKTLYKNISTSEKENESFKKLISKGVKVTLQVVPTDKETDISKYIK